jgi:hypothetical protein
MGNEASIPEDEGLKPPSQAPPQGELHESMRVGKALKVAKSVLQKASDATAFRDQNGDSTNAIHQPPPQTYYEDIHAPMSSAYSTDGLASVKALSTSAAAQQAANTIRSGGKVVRNSGRALMNSMRNLTVGTTGKTGAHSDRTVQPAPNSGGSLRAEHAWETNWDDDVDDDDDDSDENNGEADRYSPLAAVSEVSERTLDISSTPPPYLPHSQQEWNSDLCLRPKSLQLYEKPNLQAFLPLLRVLGKGSFGKVCHD